MYARLTKSFIRLDKIEEGIAIYKDAVLPASQKQHGFRAIFLLVERETGTAVSLSLWEDEKDVLANEKNLFYQQQLMNFVPLYSADPFREGYEVAAADLYDPSREMTFARLTTKHIRPELLDKSIAMNENSVLTASQKQPGYCGTYLLLDREANTTLTVTFWATQADATTDEANNYYQQQLVKFIPLFSSDPVREGYEVVVACIKGD